MKQKQTVPDAHTVEIYFGGPHKAAKSFILGQGFEPIGFDGEQMLVRRDWAERLIRGHIKPTKILSKAARAAIEKAVRSGDFKHRPTNATEPPLMRPSTKPDDYSMWCSFCLDFGETLILCAGCRVGICSNGSTSNRGCAIWDPKVNDTDFVFYCPYCSKRRKQQCPIKLKNANAIPANRAEVVFRYDPPVLINYVRWHETKQSFGKLIRDHLYLSYAGNEESLMLVERPLNGTPKTGLNDANIAHYTTSDDPTAAETFLKTYPTAKIIFIVDTHCLENGFFVYKGASPSTYRACSLFEILRDCSPKGVFKYLSNSTGTKTHRHKSLIVNLACGASISQIGARSELLNGHDADIISLANESTVVGKVAPRLVEFITHWVQTPSDYHVLFAKTIPNDWAKIHQPVLSRNRFNKTPFTTYLTGKQGTPVPMPFTPSLDRHMLFTKFSYGEPKGMLAPCYIRCNQEIVVKGTQTGVRLTCHTCRTRATIPQFKTDRSTVLGRRALVAVRYPQEVFLSTWVAIPNGSDKSDDDTSPIPPPETSRISERKAPHEAPANLSLHPPPPDAITRSNSLPVDSTSATASPPLTIRLPARMASTSALSTAVQSQMASTSALSTPEQSRSATATPPPPSPRESQEPPQLRKRPFTQSAYLVVSKKPKP